MPPAPSPHSRPPPHTATLRPRLAGEESRKQWIAYYVSTGQHAQAREYGWDGEEVERVEAAPPPVMPGPAKPERAVPSSSCESPIDESATKIQSIYRGKTARDQKEEMSRLEWIQFYRGTGQLSKAKELGWEPEAEAQSQNQFAPSSFTAPSADVTALVVANLSTTSREASRTASPRKSPRSNSGLRGWFSSLFGVVNDYDDPTLEYDGSSTNGVNTHQSATKLQAAARGQLARRQVAAANEQARGPKQSAEEQAAATLQRARRRSVELREGAAARNAAEDAAGAERTRRDEEDEHAAAAALKAGGEAAHLGGLTRLAMEDGTCRQLRGVMCAASRAQQGMKRGGGVGAAGTLPAHAAAHRGVRQGACLPGEGSRLGLKVGYG